MKHRKIQKDPQKMFLKKQLPPYCCTPAVLLFWFYKILWPEADVRVDWWAVTLTVGPLQLSPLPTASLTSLSSFYGNSVPPSIPHCVIQFVFTFLCQPPSTSTSTPPCFIWSWMICNRGWSHQRNGHTLYILAHLIHLFTLPFLLSCPSVGLTRSWFVLK